MGGEGAWNSLDPTIRNALLVQYHNQGPERNVRAAVAADRIGMPYVPRIGADGAGANYVANEGALDVALTSPAYWVDQSKTAYQPANQAFPSYTPGFVPGQNPLNPGGRLDTGSPGVSNALIGLLPSPVYRPRNALNF